MKKPLLASLLFLANLSPNILASNIQGQRFKATIKVTKTFKHGKNLTISKSFKHEIKAVKLKEYNKLGHSLWH